jgi:hypothetical protein
MLFTILYLYLCFEPECASRSVLKKAFVLTDAYFFDSNSVLSTLLEWIYIVGERECCLHRLLK